MISSTDRSQDRAKPFGVGESWQVARAAGDGVVHDDEPVACVGVLSQCGKVGLQDAEVRRISTERVAESEKERCLEREDTFLGFELGDRQQYAYRFGDEFVGQCEVVPTLFSRTGTNLAPRSVVVRIVVVTHITADAEHASAVSTNAEQRRGRVVAVNANLTSEATAGCMKTEVEVADPGRTCRLDTEHGLGM